MDTRRLLSIPYIKEAIGFGAAVVSATALTWLLSEFGALGYTVSADTGFVTVVAVALLIFALLGGRLTEFSFGGVSAKFEAAAKTEVAAQDIVVGRELSQFEKEGVAALPRLIRQLSTASVAGIELHLGSGMYRKPDIAAYAREFTAATKRSYFVVTSDGRFVGAIDTSKIVALCACESLVHNAQAPPARDLLQEFVDAVNENNSSALILVTLLQTRSAAVGIDNKTALQKMEEFDADFLVLLDEQKRPVKIALRQEIVAQLLLAATG